MTIADYGGELSGEALAAVDRWLSEARIARDIVSFALPPSSNLAAGDTVKIDAGNVNGTFRIDRVQDGGLKQVEAVRVEPGIYASAGVEDLRPIVGEVVAPLPVWAETFELPQLPGADPDEAPLIAATAEPWPGDVAVY